MGARFASLIACIAALAGCSQDYARLKGGVAAFDGGVADTGARHDAEHDAAPVTDDAAPEDAGGEPDGSADGGADAGGDGGCRLRLPPDRPALGADLPSLPVRWYALRRIDLGIGDLWRSLGYDLDGRCTTSESTLDELECAPAPGFVPSDDAPGGADNAFGQSFVPLISLVDAAYQDELHQEIELGEHGVLVRVAEWNGTPDDPVIDVALVDSVRGFAAGADLTDVIEPPRWDTTDEWLVSDGAFVASDIDVPVARDVAAYVTDGVVVARPRSGTQLRLTGSLTVVLPLDRAIFTARLSETTFELEEGVLAGRVAIDDVIDSLPGLGYCPGTMMHGVYATAMQRAADLAISEGAPPGLPCTAISMAIGFRAVQARVGQIVPDRPERDLCDGMPVGPTGVPDDLCTADCPTANDALCDDGGNGSRRITCDLGSDCADCGHRRG
ncbi:MAG: hypothetical protein IT379_04230 [Deltaproteobacteria bacterium]|nr:hypothetical protein [Deltaproteobacteria bacterium]